MTELTVAKTILEQLGGNRFIAMTGAKNLLGAEDNLSFKLPANFAKDGINTVVITLDASDTYRLKFVKLGRAPKFSITLVKEYEGIYCDQLREIFEKTTGLRTSL